MNYLFEGAVEIEQGPESMNGEKEDEGIKDQRKRNIKMVVSTVGKKLIRNPNTYATLIGIVWACIHFRYCKHYHSSILF